VAFLAKICARARTVKISVIPVSGAVHPVFGVSPRLGGKRHYLGTTREEAARAHDAAAIERFGREFATTTLPPLKIARLEANRRRRRK